MQAFKAKGIPLNVEIEGDTVEYKEIMFLRALVKAVSNPLDSISLLAVMMSPVFGFTADEVAEIRMIDKDADLYYCLTKYAEGSVKCKKFLSKLQLRI